MWINPHLQSMLRCFLAKFADVLNVLLIISQRARMLKRLPSNKEPKHGESTGAHALEMFITLFQGTWPANKGHTSMVSENVLSIACFYVGAFAILWLHWELGIPRKVQTPRNEFSPFFINPPSTIPCPRCRR
jgi:hypothetical protein